MGSVFCDAWSFSTGATPSSTPLDPLPIRSSSLTGVRGDIPTPSLVGCVGSGVVSSISWGRGGERPG